MTNDVCSIKSFVFLLHFSHEATSRRQFACFASQDPDLLRVLHFLCLVIVKASSGPRYVVGCRSKIDRNTLKAGSRVALDITTLTIMRKLPREVDPVVYNMTTESPGDANYAGIGGLTEQIRELREVRA